MNDRLGFRGRLGITSFLMGFGLGAGVGLLMRWLINTVFAAWLVSRMGANAPHSGWSDVICLALVFGFGMLGAARTLSSIYSD